MLTSLARMGAVALALLGLGTGSASATTTVALDVRPVSALRDTTLTRFEITGLARHQVVAVEVRSDDLPGAGPWTATARFRADARGRVDLRTTAPLDGPYRGADVMGLLWSLNTVNAPVPGGEFLGLGVVDAVFFGAIPLGDWTATVTVRDTGGAPLATRQLIRRSQSPGHPVTHERIQPTGTYSIDVWYPSEQRPRNTVVLLPGGASVVPNGTCEMLAARGHFCAAAPLAGSGMPGAPEQWVEIPVEFVRSEIEAVLAHPAAVGDEVVLGGPSGGAVGTLLTAQTYPELVKGIILAEPEDWVVGGFAGGAPVGDRAEWSRNGTGLPFIPWDLAVWQRVLDGGPPFRLGELISASYRQATRQEIAASRLRVDAVDGPVFMSVGAESDAVCTCLASARRLAQRFRAAGHTGVDLYVGPRSGHTTGYAPAWTPRPSTVVGGVQLIGGTLEGNSRDNDVAWRLLLDWLRHDGIQR
ncbi:acyl-CoA thioesterase/BAAT N-terminal domain-containing protein [Herbidospora cretacea]|uniref:acyl-CoA thioesterase/BAAT N-terminal domain-containing protein n=1 Tax=Herbidospora cretacea TaxID=28444 RepID=UPI0009DDC4BF|nr:acyl-CoA thioesterase/BAAT N-terminal domain-containing protein [Herbidospora cretacea]